jgi:hypothetical protein
MVPLLWCISCKKSKIGHNKAYSLPGSKNSYQTLELEHTTLQLSPTLFTSWLERVVISSSWTILAFKSHFMVPDENGWQLPQASGSLPTFWLSKLCNIFSTPNPNLVFSFHSFYSEIP